MMKDLVPLVGLENEWSAPQKVLVYEGLIDIFNEHLSCTWSIVIIDDWKSILTIFGMDEDRLVDLAWIEKRLAGFKKCASI